MLDKKRVIEVMQKAAKCWAGYERVPGTKAYTSGSCRPTGSKKTKKEVIQGKNHTEPKEKRGEYYTGKYSQRPFNADHARQTLGPSASNMSDEAAYMEMINKFENGSLDPIQFQAFNTQYGKYRPKFQAKPGSPQPPQVQAPQARPPVAKRPSPCGPGGCPVPRPVKPTIPRTPNGAPRLVPGVPPPRPAMDQMPPKTAKVDFTQFAPKAVPPAKPVVANVSRKTETPATVKPKPIPRVAPTVPPVDAKVPPLK